MFIVGHKNPDTDSVISAIVLGRLLSATPAVAGKPNKETEYVLNRFGYGVPDILPNVEKEVILVDHNSPDEMIDYISSHEIKGLFDHHRLGGIFTSNPVPVRVESTGSTATLVAKISSEKNAALTPQEAGLLISAIISDTLKFTSPTTTEEDKVIANKLNESAKIDIDELASEMFKAKSDISDVSTEELVGKDYKIFEMNGKKVGFGVWETVVPDSVLERKENLLKNLEEKRSMDDLDFIFFAVVDILNNDSKLFLVSSSEEEVAKDVFKGEDEEHIMHLPGVCSRKKQLVPPLEEYFQKYASVR